LPLVSPRDDCVCNFMRIHLVIFFCFLMILAGCGKTPQQSDVIELPAKKEMKKKSVKAGKDTVIKKKSKVAEVVPEKVNPPTILAKRQKKLSEFVSVDGELYSVPLPWRGHKIAEKAPLVSELQQVPIEFTYNQSKIYIHKNACDAFIKMAEKAQEEDVHLLVHSGFRSLRYQKQIFSNLMARGRTWEDLVRYVAPPGYSEHMLGVVVDLYPSNWQFAKTAEYSWLKENAEAFGFVESYPEKSSNGFPWESWHWRFADSSSR